MIRSVRLSVFRSRPERRPVPEGRRRLPQPRPRSQCLHALTRPNAARVPRRGGSSLKARSLEYGNGSSPPASAGWGRFSGGAQWGRGGGSSSSVSTSPVAAPRGLWGGLEKTEPVEGPRKEALPLASPVKAGPVRFARAPPGEAPDDQQPGEVVSPSLGTGRGPV